MRKKWLAVPVIVGIAAIVSTTVIFAQTPTPNPGKPAKTFASRVADILGLSETQVQDAIDQASKDMHDEAIKAKLDAMVAAGRITQAQADEYYHWYQSRPEGLERPGGPARGGGFGHGVRGFGFGRPGKMMPGLPAPYQTPTTSTTPTA